MQPVQCSTYSTRGTVQLQLGWTEGNGSLFTLFQVAFGLPIAFSISLEGSVMEIKPAAPVSMDTAVNLKA